MPPPSELLDALSAPSTTDALRELDDGGHLTRLFPELEAGRGFGQPELHYYDVLDHNLAAVAAVEAALGDGADGRELRQSLEWIDLDGSLEREVEGIPVASLVRLACLVHDVAKPATATIVEGRLRFPRHGPTGAEMMGTRLPELGFGPEARAFICGMVRYHLRPGELIRAWPPTDHAVRRFVTALDGHVLPLMLVNLADGMATRGPGYTRENFRRHCNFLNYVVARSWAVMEEGPPALLSGEEAMTELDIEGGRLLGAVLTSLRRAQLEGAIASRDEALLLARSILAGAAGRATSPGR
ncbi:MAG: HD domain-containing protein [Chloroflexi bacterium]|nr:HD domain-containing protein [Chloroflexota bacterium]